MNTSLCFLVASLVLLWLHATTLAHQGRLPISFAMSIEVLGQRTSDSRAGAFHTESTAELHRHFVEKGAFRGWAARYHFEVLSNLQLVAVAQFFLHWRRL